MVPVVVMAALVAFAGTVLLRQPAATTAAGTVTSVRTDEVCLSTSGTASASTASTSSTSRSAGCVPATAST